MTEWTGNGADWARNAPVFATNNEFEWGGRTWPYPDVWVTEQRCEPTAERTGRMCVGHYTPDTDPDGGDALYYGGGYYDEGMACMGEGEHEKRIMCFQAAELLYLHASNLGNPFGDLCLGYVYSYDRCEGSYWGDERPFDPEGHALAHFGAAARTGIPEACYKYGDLLRDGRGCDANFDEAYLWFSRAWESADEERASVLGSVALRLGQAHEMGEGCRQGFDVARDWYERSVTWLSAAVREGDSWYRGSLRRAEAGLARCKQELSGKY